MKKYLIIAALFLVSGVAFGFSVQASDDDSLDVTTYTLDEMLILALEDEWHAQVTYEAIMDTYGVIKPFSNIVVAEANHASLLIPLFETYGVELPAMPNVSDVVVPASLSDAYQLGVDAEILNIALYESFIEQGVPEDVEAVFNQLIFGSEHHLKAFSNALFRSTKPQGTCGQLVSSNQGMNQKGPQYKGGK